MNVLLITATACFILLGIAFSVLFVRLASSDRARGFPDDSEEIFSPARYRAMERLLDEGDQKFLRSQPGCTEGTVKNFRKARVRIFRGYMQQLSHDFNRICKAINLLIITSEVERRDLAGAVMKHQFLFAFGMMSAEVKLISYGFGWSRVEVGGLLRSFETMRSRLQCLAALAQPGEAFSRG